MLRNCFAHSINLETYPSDEGYFYSKCLIRGRTIVLTPEEEVRQSVLFYFLKYSSIDVKNFIIRVEHQNLDIAFYLKFPDENFQPSQNPIIIFELKRDETNIEEHQLQLITYMNRFNCDHGVLTDSNQIIYINRSNLNPIKFDSITELEKLIAQFPLYLEQDLQDFYQANNGNFSCFKKLAEKYGRSSKFMLLCKEYNSPIECFCFRIIDKYVLFDFCGIRSKRKQNKFTEENFVQLLSIKE